MIRKLRIFGLMTVAQPGFSQQIGQRETLVFYRTF